MNHLLRIFRDPGDGGGGGSATAVAPAPVAPAPAAAIPAATGASSPQGGAPAAAGQPATAAGVPAQGGAGQPAAAAPAAAAPWKSALDGLPQRGTPEYAKAYNALPIDQQQKIETELFDRLQNPAKYADLEKQAATPAAAPAAADGGEPAEIFLTQEEFNALPPNAQAVVNRMQDVIKQVEPYIGDGQLAKGMERMIANPIIKAEMARMSGAADPYEMPAELETAFDPSKIVKVGDLDKMDFALKPEEAKAKLSELLLKAAEWGSKQTAMKSEVVTQQKVALERRTHLFRNQLTELQNSMPSLKSDLPLHDANNPLNSYLKWANTNLGDSWLEKHGQKAGHAAYLAVTGGLDKAMQTVAKNTHLNFVRAVESGVKQVATMGRGAPAATPARTVMDGIDLDKYKSDMAYRQSSFNSAPQNVRMKLEQWMSTGKIPT